MFFTSFLINILKVMVFDFGSEVYAYSGKNASFEERKVGARLAQERICSKCLQIIQS